MRADNKDNLIIAVAGMVPVTWLALKLTPYSREPLVDIISVSYTHLTLPTICSV